MRRRERPRSTVAAKDYLPAAPKPLLFPQDWLFALRQLPALVLRRCRKHSQVRAGFVSVVKQAVALEVAVGGANVETLPFGNSICVDDLFRDAGARADTTCASGWANLRCRSTGIAARFTMRLPLGRYGTPIRLCGEDKADRPRCWNNQRGKAVLGRVRADNACRPKHLER